MRALTLTLMLAGLTAAVSGARQAPPERDDRYVFTPGLSEERTLSLSPAPQGVEFPWTVPAARAWDTALLAIRVTASGPMPMLEITAGARRIDQYLDPDARGLRWINLTSLRGALADGTVVRLTGRDLAVELGAATLRVFANGLDLRSAMLILAPHPDDAEIAAFGLYAGRNATIVTITAGNAGPLSYGAHFTDPAEHYRFKGHLRVVDSVTVPWLGEIPPERCFNLGYFDARLEAMRQNRDEPVAEMYGPNRDVLPYRRANLGRLLPVRPRLATWTHLVEDLVAVLRKVKPAIVVMPHPWLDSHRDHQYTAVAAVEALDRWKGRPQFLLYTNHAARNQFPFGPAGTVMSLPPWSEQDQPIERVYSHPVDAATQRRKLYALEAMHDLRLSPDEQSRCRIPGQTDCPPLRTLDYFRRGVRSEELFFAFGRDGIRDLIGSFLDRSARATP